MGDHYSVLPGAEVFEQPCCGLGSSAIWDDSSINGTGGLWLSHVPLYLLVLSEEHPDSSRFIHEQMFHFLGGSQIKWRKYQVLSTELCVPHIHMVMS